MGGQGRLDKTGMVCTFPRELLNFADTVLLPGRQAVMGHVSVYASSVPASLYADEARGGRYDMYVSRESVIFVGSVPLPGNKIQ